MNELERNLDELYDLATKTHEIVEYITVHLDKAPNEVTETSWVKLAVIAIRMKLDANAAEKARDKIMQINTKAGRIIDRKRRGS